MSQARRAFAHDQHDSVSFLQLFLRTTPGYSIGTEALTTNSGSGQRPRWPLASAVAAKKLSNRDRLGADPGCANATNPGESGGVAQRRAAPRFLLHRRCPTGDCKEGDMNTLNTIVAARHQRIGNRRISASPMAERGAGRRLLWLAFGRRLPRGSLAVRLPPHIAGIGKGRADTATDFARTDNVEAETHNARRQLWVP
jgi:hypothetical protein